MKYFLNILMVALFSTQSFATSWPQQPTDNKDHGSASYPFAVEESKQTINGRAVDLILPTGKGPFPVVVFGHGQAIGVSAYLETFRHLAGKGVAVVFPQFDTGFFDQNWGRMASDFASLAKAAIAQSGGRLSSTDVVFSGHSKGAYVALMAMGLSDQSLPAKAGLFFSPAGYDRQYLVRLNPKAPVTLVWGNEDTIVRPSVGTEIYGLMNIERKQFIHVGTYAGATPALKADHFFILNESSFMGGQNGISPFHYFGAWKWLLGAVADDEYLYGTAAATTGWDQFTHRIEKNF